MRNRISMVLLLMLLAMTGAFIAPRAGAAQQSGSTFQSVMLWAPSLKDAGDALAQSVNQIDSACSVDVDSVATTNGAGPEGPVYAFAITWSCPAETSESGTTWQSAMLWTPSLQESGDALAEVVGQIDAGCSVDVDSVTSTNGAGPEGPVFAFAITWGCPEPDGASAGTWQSGMIWNPDLAGAGDALAGLVNQIDATCSIDTDTVAATNGAGPEGVVYAFAVTWSCPEASGASNQPANEFAVTIRDFSFEPSQLSIPADTETTVRITNEGASPHTFSIDEFDLSLELAAGESSTITITALAGDYDFYCAVPGHRDAGMQGILSAE